jgi:hypothetical protein
MPGITMSSSTTSIDPAASWLSASGAEPTAIGS